MARPVRLMLTCLCDAYFGEVGIAAVKVLEAAGCEVIFEPNQTCCGQPPFNSGDWAAARKVAEHAKKTLFPGDGVPVVTPSGSCAAMVREGYPLLWPGSEHLACFEVGEFLSKELGITAWHGKIPPRKVAFHRACHGRGIGLKDEQEKLLRGVEGIEIVAMEQAEQCCGFGGAFSANHSAVSNGIGTEKIKHIVESGAETVVSGDMGCLMHLGGLMKRQGLTIKTQHYLELLAEASS